VVYNEAGLAAAKDIIMIDLSDIVNFPHNKATTVVHITKLEISIKIDATFAGTLELGFLKNVDASNGDLYTFKKFTFGAGAVQNIYEDKSASPDSPIVCSTDYILTQTIAVDDTAFQTDVALPSPYDDTAAYTTVSGDGDIVLRITRSAGTIDFNVAIQYYVETPPS
jgi:hypothetical protein